MTEECAERPRNKIPRAARVKEGGTRVFALRIAVSGSCKAWLRLPSGVSEVLPRAPNPIARIFGNSSEFLFLRQSID